MKVLQINCVYPSGSTGKIVKDIDYQLNIKGVDSYVVFGRGISASKKTIKLCSLMYCRTQKVISMLTGLMYGGCFFSTLKLIRILKKIKPDVVHLHCINGNFVNIYKLVAWLKSNNIKTILTLHAEFIHTGNCGHSFECNKWLTGCGKCNNMKKVTKSLFFDNTHKSWLKMKKAFDGFENNLIVTSVSSWLMNRATMSPILKNKKHYVVLNGLDDNIFHYYDTDDLRKKMNLDGKKVIFHASPNFNGDVNNIKGGYFVIELAKKMPTYIFVVAGAHSLNMLVPSNLILLGKIDNQNELARYYSMSDVTILTSKRETFSMVTAESLCCGTPVVGFKAGAPETIAIKDFSDFVDYGDVDKLFESVNRLLNNNFDKKRISEEAIKMYSKKNMVDAYYDLYNKLIRLE